MQNWAFGGPPHFTAAWRVLTVSCQVQVCNFSGGGRRCLRWPNHFHPHSFSVWFRKLLLPDRAPHRCKPGLCPSSLPHSSMLPMFTFSFPIVLRPTQIYFWFYCCRISPFFLRLIILIALLFLGPFPGFSVPSSGSCVAGSPLRAEVPPTWLQTLLPMLLPASPQDSTNLSIPKTSS